MASDAPTRRGRIADLAEQLTSLRETRDETEVVYKRAVEAYEAVEADLFDALEGAGMRGFKHPRLGTFSLNDLAWPRVEDEELARGWAEAQHPEYITLNRQRLVGLVRESLRDGVELPPGISFTASRKIRITKR